MIGYLYKQNVQISVTLTARVWPYFIGVVDHILIRVPEWYARRCIEIQGEEGVIMGVAFYTQTFPSIKNGFYSSMITLLESHRNWSQ